LPRRFDTSGRRDGATGCCAQARAACQAQTIFAGFDHVVLATGVVPRTPRRFRGIDHPKVASYFRRGARLPGSGQRVAIVGAGGIGSNRSELLTHHGPAMTPPIGYLRSGGSNTAYPMSGGGLAATATGTPQREVWLLQRKSSKVGDGLAKTTGWIRRNAADKKRGGAR